MYIEKLESKPKKTKKFKDLVSGEAFFSAHDGLFIRYNGRESSDYNAVNLKTGRGEYFNDENEIYEIDATISYDYVYVK